MTNDTSLAIAWGLAGVFRALAEPTYAVSRFGRAVQFPAGTVIRPLRDSIVGSEPFPDAIRVVAADGSPFEREMTTVVRRDGTTPPPVDIPALWWVTASALRFEEPKTPCVCGRPDCAERDDDGSIRVGDEVRIIDPEIGRWKTIDIVSENFVSVGGTPHRRYELVRDMAEGRVEWRRGEVGS